MMALFFRHFLFQLVLFASLKLQIIIVMIKHMLGKFVFIFLRPSLSLDLVSQVQIHLIFRLSKEIETYPNKEFLLKFYLPDHIPVGMEVENHQTEMILVAYFLVKCFLIK